MRRDVFAHLCVATWLVSMPYRLQAQAQVPAAEPTSPHKTGADPAVPADIIVTANRQGAASLQKIPMSITAINPESLVSKGQSGLLDIAALAPGVNIQQAGPGINRIDMRGITTGSIDVTNVQDRPLVGVYLDDVPLALQSGNPDIRVFDLERIEVVRGPQGTLFGAGSMAGTLRYITVKPSTKAVAGSADVDLSGTDHGGANYSLRGIVNLPVSDTLAFRLGGYQGRDSGFIDNTGLGRKDANFVTSTQARGAARWTPGDRLTVDASITFEKLDAHGQNDGFAGQSRYTYSTSVPEGFRDNLKIYNLAGSYDLGFASINTSTSYVDRHTTSLTDLSYLAPLFGLDSYSSEGIVKNHLRIFTEEVRLVSKKSDVFNWTVGLYYERTKRNYYQDTPTPGFDAAYGELIGTPGFNSQTDYQAFQPNDVFSGLQNIDEYQFAQFAQGTLTLGKFDLTAGVRHFDFRQDFNLFFSGVGGSVAEGEPLTTTGRAKAHGFNPRFVVAYRPSETSMIYAEAAKGFRYGGVNQPVPDAICGQSLSEAGLASAPLTFGPDHLWSYSVGEKSQFFDRRVTLDVDAFYIDWRDVQTQRNLTCSYSFTQNQGRVRSIGVELDSRFRVTPALSVTLNASYTDSEANGPIPNADAANGDRSPYFPKYTVSLNGDYVVPVGNGTLTLSAGVSTRGSSYTEFSPENPLRREIPGSTVANASATYDIGKFTFGLYGTNLNNSRRISLVTASLPTDVADRVYYGRPRTIGARAKVKF